MNNSMHVLRVGFLSVVFVLAGACAGAQGGEEGMAAEASADRHHYMTLNSEAHAARLQEALDLTPDQTLAAQAIFDEFQPRMNEFHTQFGALRHADGPVDEQAFAALKVEKHALMAEQADRLGAVLSPEQLERFEVLKASHHGHKKHGAHSEHTCDAHCSHAGS